MWRVLSCANICKVYLHPKMSGVKILGELIDDMIGRMVRDGKGRSPVEKAVQGAVEVREKVV